MTDEPDDEPAKVRPLKDKPCVIPGCPKKFRQSTMYRDFLDHYRQKHGDVA